MSMNHFVLCADGKWRSRRGRVIAGTTPPVDPPDDSFWAGMPMLYGANDSHFDVDGTNSLASGGPGTGGGWLYLMQGEKQQPVMRRFYEGAWPTAPTNKENQDFGRGVIPWVSFSGPPAAQIAAGQHDATIAQYWQNSTQPKLITYRHEVDHNNKETPENFRAAQERIWSLKQQHCPNNDEVLFGPILMGWAFTTGSGYNFQQWMTPGSMDFIGTDPYRFWRPQVMLNNNRQREVAPIDPSTGGYGTKRSMQYSCEGVSQGQTLISYAADLGIPIAIGESSAHPDPDDANDRPSWYQQTHDYLTTLPGVKCLAFMDFHGPWGGRGSWYIDRTHYFTASEGDPQRHWGRADWESINKRRELIGLGPHPNTGQGG